MGTEEQPIILDKTSTATSSRQQNLHFSSVNMGLQLCFLAALMVACSLAQVDEGKGTVRPINNPNILKAILSTVPDAMRKKFDDAFFLPPIKQCCEMEDYYNCGAIRGTKAFWYFQRPYSYICYNREVTYSDCDKCIVPKSCFIQGKCQIDRRSQRVYATCIRLWQNPTLVYMWVWKTVGVGCSCRRSSIIQGPSDFVAIGPQ